MKFPFLGLSFRILFLFASRAGKNGCPNGGRAHLPRGELGGMNVGTQSRNQYWVAHRILREGREPRVEVGGGTAKLDVGQGG